jgi:glyoxylase-like metal-dependent hydrolase (beta-lactamase superfamily II)
MRTTLRIGDVEITAICDKVHDFNPGWHFPSVEPEAWEPYSDLIEGPDGYVLVNFHCFLLRGGNQTVLIDTGWGPELGPPGAPKESGALMDDLEGLGVEPSDIDVVAFTHLHADHVGWNLVYEDEKISPRFTNARYLVSEPDWAFFSAREENHPNIAQQAIPLAEIGVLDTFQDGHSLTRFLTAEATPGHTPGHMSFVVQSSGERLYILGDLIHHPVIAHETDWVHKFDADPEMAVSTRKRILDRLEHHGTAVAAGHLQHPSFGRFARVDGRRVWKPIDAGPAVG